MFHSPAHTFYQNVVPTYDEYVRHRDALVGGYGQHLRTAIAAATALYHFREHLPPELAASGKRLEERSSDFALLRGVVNASKHKNPDQKSPLVRAAADIHEVVTTVLFTDPAGEYRHCATMVQVVCADGITRWLDPSITRVLNHWGALLDAEVFSPRPEPEQPGERYIERDNAADTLDLVALRGLDLLQQMKLLRFDDSLGKAVPFDLNGAEIEFRVYAPPSLAVDVTMSHPEHGEVTVSVPLTSRETVALHSVKNGDERTRFYSQLLQTHRPEIERMIVEKLRIQQRGPHQPDPNPPSAGEGR